MEVLMILTYAAICYAIFKIFRLPLNKWTVPPAVLGGVILIALILLVMNYNYPYKRQARLYFYTTPIVPVVRGAVIEVPVTPNVPLIKGAVLFRIDPRHYQYVVDQKRPALAEAEQNVLQLKAALDVARANVNEARASRDRAKQSFDRYDTAGSFCSEACLSSRSRSSGGWSLSRRRIAAATWPSIRSAASSHASCACRSTCCGRAATSSATTPTPSGFDPARTRFGSVYGMTPGSPLITGLADIPIAPGIPAHSIIAVRGDGPVAAGSDGVVRYGSAHIDGVESELVVRSGHSVQSKPQTVLDLRRILLLHAAEACARDGIGCPEAPALVSEAR